MKNLSLLLLILMGSIASMSQKNKPDSWKIFHNRKEVAAFSISDNDEEKRLVLLNRAIEEPGFLIITYTPSRDAADWKRTFWLTDSTGRELKKFENTSQLKLSNDDLERLIQGKPKLLIYTSAIPNDPNQAATVRVRRILLCTIYTR